MRTKMFKLFTQIYTTFKNKLYKIIYTHINRHIYNFLIDLLCKSGDAGL